MTTPKRRQFLYSDILHFMKDNRVNTVPIDLNQLCSRAGVDLVPLSNIVKDAGLSADEIFNIWGNEDGSVTYFGGKHRIAYNDGQPSGRIRFTICEELAHIVFKHTEDPDFNVFCQSYNSEKYKLYDEEARIGAGFLICHPKLFYAYEHCLTPAHLSVLCDITLPCAKARHDIFKKYKPEILANPTYHFTNIPRTQKNIRKVVGL